MVTLNYSDLHFPYLFCGPARCCPDRQIEFGALPVPHLPSCTARVSQDRATVLSVHGCPGVVRIPFRVGGTGKGSGIIQSAG